MSIYGIDPKYLVRKSYLYNASKMCMKENMSECDIDILDYVKNANEYDVEQYKNYLMFSDFEMTPGFLEILNFDQGVMNYLMFDDDMFKEKIKEDLIRDKFYELELWKTPYFHLKKINLMLDVNKKIFDVIYGYLPKDKFIIAGGAINGNLPESDIDIFYYGGSVDDASSRIEEFIEKLNSPDVLYSENSISAWIDKDWILAKVGIKFKVNLKVQFIKRIYSSPAEILYGFDIPACAFLYDGMDTYCTPGALLSFQNKIIYLDPSRASRSYGYRLVKYGMRGYLILLPSFDMKKLKIKEINNYFLKLKDDDKISQQDILFLHFLGRDMKPWLKDYQFDYVNVAGNDPDHEASNRRYWEYVGRGKGLKGDDLKQFINDKLSTFTIILNHDDDGVIYNRVLTFRNDQVLVTYRGHNISIQKINDELIKELMKDDSKDAERSLYLVDSSKGWMTHNPMKQLTGSFHPEDISNLEKWYAKSDFYI